MAEFLTTSGISHHIENIIMGATKELTLVSPFLKISKTLNERLRDASRRNVRIRILYGKNELQPSELKSLAQVNNLKLLFFENLHAKCYYNESEMVITSMNMYEFSEKNNREMGVKISLQNDQDLFINARNETNSIIGSSLSEPFVNEKKSGKFKKASKKKAQKKVWLKGFCLRCESRINYNPEKPYCSNCYAIWAQYENPEYEENFCHSCGDENYSSLVKPVCYSCYKSN